jgi:hypothetical protein
MDSIRAKVRERTDRRYASASMELIVGRLNPVLRGWGNYCVPRGRARSDRRRWSLMI